MEVNILGRPAPDERIAGVMKALQKNKMEAYFVPTKEDA